MALVRPTKPSWSSSGWRSQTSMVMLIRRATRYEPPASHAACGSSSAPTQTCSSRASVSSALTFAVPSLKPNRLRGVDCDVEVVDVRPKPELRPADRDRAEADPGQVADRVHGHLRVLRRRPARTGRRPSGPGRGCRRGSAAGPSGRRAVGRRGRASRRTPGPKPNVIVSPAGGSPIASPVSSGGRSAAPSVGPTGPAPWPCIIRSAASVQAFSSGDDLLARVGGQVERREVQPVLRRGDDAGLVGAAERVRTRLPVPDRRPGRPVGVVDGGVPHHVRARHPGGGRAAAEEARAC